MAGRRRAELIGAGLERRLPRRGFGLRDVRRLRHQPHRRCPTQRATRTCDLASHHQRSAFPLGLFGPQLQESRAGQALPCGMHRGQPRDVKGRGRADSDEHGPWSRLQIGRKRESASAIQRPGVTATTARSRLLDHEIGDVLYAQTRCTYSQLARPRESNRIPLFLPTHSQYTTVKIFHSGDQSQEWLPGRRRYSDLRPERQLF